ncbi:disease resistance protein RGA5-like isoform X2 [Phragmites australis]|uniref:disease resistance protein RGA5-like isoform X2 n=1 Tax=Phragmites australis TaxID=29695 RepID=UPI002D786395|nr:disease resistance protein RGA5-like isoform X2 [Phragmites australis]
MEVVVGVSTGVMKPLLSKLTKLLGEEYAKLKGVRKQIKFLRDELIPMSETLQILADAEHLSGHMKDWRGKLRELAYDIEDCVDAFMVRVDCDGPMGFINGFVHRLKKLITRHEIADEIEELKSRVMEVSERHTRYNIVEQASNSRTVSIDPRLPALYEEIDRLVGIDAPKNHIIERLSMGTDELKVVSIVGCGGLGKTTLANQVYHAIKSQFWCTAFVSVSQTPDIRKILIDIAREVGITDNTLDNDRVQRLINKLREYLQDKRYFIVIDDIWVAKDWKTIRLALLDNNCGSRVITTTRSIPVATCSSSQGGYVYQMEPLSFDDSKSLFFKRAFGSENSCYPHLEDVPDRILSKCGGLPLAIITVSSMLTNEHARAEWDRVLNAIGSALANLKDPDAEKMTSILSLSYFDLPHHLRTCLLYLSVFPEDCWIQKQRLINRWIAEGFIHEEQERSAYEIGEYYFNDLINRSMIQPAGDVKYGQANACRVHDIILDYIKCKAAEENFVTTLDAAEHGYTSEYKVRRLCVNNRNEENVTICAGLILSNVRSFTIFGYTMQSSLSAFTSLRVLDLGDCEDMKDHHLVNIEMMFHLKYLRLGSKLITKLPEKIGELQYLQTLDVRGTRIEELPPTITKLQRLTHLYVGWTTKFPNGMIGQMHSLEELRQYGVRSYEQGKTLEEFSKLTKLRTLKMKWDFDLPDALEGLNQSEGIYSHVETLLSSCNLHNLSISDYGRAFPLLLDSWHPVVPCSVRKLSLKAVVIYKVPNWMGTLGNLGVLKLVIMCLRPEDVEILGAIPSLLFLELLTDGGTNGSIIVPGSNGFRSLKYFSLRITRCGTALEFEVGSMPKLEHVKLEFFEVRNMECLNGASNFGIQHLSALSKVEVCIGRPDGINAAFECVARAIIAAVETLPNHPTITFETKPSYFCEHYIASINRWNKLHDGMFSEWLKIWQIEEEQTEHATDGETEQEDETDEEEEEELTERQRMERLNKRIRGSDH